jgi:hypothetical protein
MELTSRTLWNKLGTGRQIVYHDTHLRYLKQSSSEMDRMVVAWGWVWGWQGSCYSMDIETVFQDEKVLDICCITMCIS